MVEVYLNSRLFHVDALPKKRTSEGRIWSRFIIAQLNDLVDLLSTSRFERVRVSLQSRRGESKAVGYEIHPLRAIYTAIDGAGQSAYVLETLSGTRLVDSLVASTIDELSGFTIVWQG